MAVYLRVHIPVHGTSRAAEVFQFPGGEMHLKDLTEFGGDQVTFIADVRGAGTDDLMAALMLADVAQHRRSKFVLMLPYLPAARADRGGPFGARVYADLINNCSYADQVICIDPHSPVMPRLVRNVKTLDAFPLIWAALDMTHPRKYDAIIAPDAGAAVRASDVAKKLGVDFYMAEKHRDFETGKILDYQVPALPRSGNYLVVDDICDGGGTFVMLANASGLPKEQLSLWVTHGIFSGNAPILKNYYNNVYTTDSHPGHNRLGCATTIIPTVVYMQKHMGV